jgi:hypothetical protein
MNASEILPHAQSRSERLTSNQLLARLLRARLTRVGETCARFVGGLSDVELLQQYAAHRDISSIETPGESTC